MRTTTFATIAAVALTLIVSTAASAGTFCVHSNLNCSGTPAATLGNALTAAAANGSGRDTIQLPAGTFSDLPAWDQAGNPVDIVGAGADATILAAGTGGNLLAIGEPTSTVSHLQVRIMGSKGGTAFYVDKGGSFDHVAVTTDASQASAIGFDTEGGTTSITDSSIDLGYTPTGNVQGVLSYNFSSVSIQRSSIIAAQAVHMQESSVDIQQSRIWAQQGIETITGGNAFVRNSTIRTPGPTPHDGSEYGVFIAGAYPQEVDILQSTIYGDFAAGSVGLLLHAYSDPTANAVAFLTDSVVAHYPTTADLNNADAPATLYAAWSAFDPTRITGNGTFGHANNVDLIERAPGFVDPDAGDFQLHPDSPLVDAADPTATSSGTSDRDGNPRISNNRVDIGALEYQRPPDAPAVTAAPATVAPLDTPSAGTSATPGAAAADAEPPALSGLSLSNKTFAIGRAKTAIAALAHGTKFRYRVSETATVVVRILHGKRTAGKLTRHAAAGANVIRFSGRIGRRALRPGRYSAVVTATDAAGNRSLPQRVRFRVIR